MAARGAGDDAARSRSPRKQTSGGGAAEELAALPTMASEEAFVEALKGAVERHGLESVQDWSDARNKHKHRAIHLAVCRSFCAAVEAMSKLGFDLNVPRPSDQCTPLHLAMFYRKPRMIETLVKLGVDRTLKNSYGDSCDEKYEAFVRSYQNIIFLDLELTAGHYEEEDGRILEVAVVVTDKDLQELGRGSWVIGGFSEAELNGLKDFHQKTFRDAEEGGKFPPRPGHKGNGLFTAIAESSTTLEQAEGELLKLLGKHCPEQACPIAGNSIQCDREVLKLQMPRVYRFLSHQIIDVSSFIGAAARWLPSKVEEWKEDQARNANYCHRAMDDVESSIQSMRWIRQHLLVQPAP